MWIPLDSTAYWIGWNKIDWNFNLEKCTSLHCFTQYLQGKWDGPAVDPCYLPCLVWVILALCTPPCPPPLPALPWCHALPAPLPRIHCFSPSLWLHSSEPFPELPSLGQSLIISHQDERKGLGVGLEWGHVSHLTTYSRSVCLPDYRLYSPWRQGCLFCCIKISTNPRHGMQCSSYCQNTYSKRRFWHSLKRYWQTEMRPGKAKAVLENYYRRNLGSRDEWLTVRGDSNIQIRTGIVKYREHA